MRVLLIAVLLLGVVYGFSEPEYKEVFTNWMQEYKRSYTSDAFQERYTIFKKNMDFVEAWNADPTHTHTCGLNNFADISNEEYKRTYLTYRVNETLMAERLAENAKLPRAIVETVENASTTGDVINWANKGAVTNIKDQGQCGACWAFSVTGSVEALNQMYTGNLISLSEQNLVDCSSKNGGCNGGNNEVAFEYIIANRGIEREANYPYEARNGPCRFNNAYTGAAMNAYERGSSGDEGALANLVNRQPVSIGIDASHNSFQLYKNGIYREGGCSTTSLDHAVLIIGYGSENGDYWLVKNSWGTGWGMSGYIWMARNSGNNCGVSTDPSVPRP